MGIKPRQVLLDDQSFYDNTLVEALGHRFDPRTITPEFHVWCNRGGTAACAAQLLELATEFIAKHQLVDCAYVIRGNDWQQYNDTPARYGIVSLAGIDEHNALHRFILNSG